MERVNVRRLPDDWSADDEALLQAIDDATASPVYIAYKLADEWFAGVHDVLDDVAALVPRKPWKALALLEHLVIRLNRAQVDDSAGQMVEMRHRLVEGLLSMDVGTEDARNARGLMFRFRERTILLCERVRRESCRSSARSVSSACSRACCSSRTRPRR